MVSVLVSEVRSGNTAFEIGVDGVLYTREEGLWGRLQAKPL